MVEKGQLMICRKRGTGYAFTPVDTMFLARAKTIRKGLAASVVLLGEAEDGVKRVSEFWQVNQLPENVSEKAALEALPRGWAPWGEGIEALKSCVGKD